MAIFSRTKKATQAVEEPQNTPTTDPVRVPPPPPPNWPPPSSPIDPTKPALTVTAEEVRARIAANRRRQSDIIRSTAVKAYTHSRTVSDCSLPGSGWQTHRVQEHKTIQAILQDMPIHEAELLPPPLVVSERAPLSRRRSEEDFHAYANPRAVPLPPIKTQALSPPPRNRSRKLTKTKPGSPLSTEFTVPDDQYFSSSSRNSARNSASTSNSETSSATSTSSIFNDRTEKRTSKVPNFSRPTMAHKREPEVEVPKLDISLPYSVKVEGVEEEVKTAKSLIPTWRYEDFQTENELPMAVTTIPPSHTRNKSWGQAHVRKSSFGTIKFRRRNLSVSEF